MYSFDSIKAGDHVRAYGADFDITGTVKSVGYGQAIIEQKIGTQSGHFRAVNVNHVTKVQ